MKKYIFALFALFALLLTSNAMAHGMSESDKARILDAGFIEYIELGATHMLTGYDHLLFLFGVIFFLTVFKDIVKFITAFTIGHSITLIFATIYNIQANYYLVDAVIALTVCYKAFENLDGFKRYLHSRSPNLMWMVFGFGLIHGFGLSTRLQQLPLGEDNIVLKIISFNVGVEVGQIIALAIMLFLLSGWRKSKSFTQFSRASNVILMLLGGLLFLMQLHSFQHSSFADEFPLNKDDHYHAHEDMQSQETSSALVGYKKRISLQAVDAEQKTTPVTAPTTPDTHKHDDGSSHSH